LGEVLSSANLDPASLEGSALWTRGHDWRWRRQQEQAGGFAVFGVKEFLAWLASLKAAINVPAVAGARRATPGAVMDLDPRAGLPPTPPPSDGFAFDAFALPRVRGAWKLDVTTPDGRTLDSRPELREGGWGKLSTVMKRHGGRWTARAMSTLDGVADAVRVKGAE
jgi:hypothetical protein